jgi:hypothetical protein
LWEFVLELVEHFHYESTIQMTANTPQFVDPVHSLFDQLQANLLGFVLHPKLFLLSWTIKKKAGNVS